MTDDNKQELAARAVACKGWRWMPGMLTVLGERVGDEAAQTSSPTSWEDDTPDLDDPATIGCLLALVREAWGDPRASLCNADSGHGWCVWLGSKRWAEFRASPTFGGPNTGGGFDGATEAEALVAALEAAPA